MTTSGWGRAGAAVLVLLVAAGCKCESTDPETDAGPGTGGVGAECMDDIECRPTLICLGDGTCGPSGDAAEGDACMLTGDCGPELFCGAARTCEPAGTLDEGGDCTSTGDCAPGLLCSISGLTRRCVAAGDADIGQDCAGDVDCLAGLSCVIGDGGARSCQSPPILPLDGGPGGGPPPTLPFWPGASCVDDEGPATAYFQVPRDGDEGGDAEFYRLPFPNDARRTASGLDLSGHPRIETALDVDVLGRHLEASETDLDGFATNPTIYFRFSRPYEWEDVNGDRLLLIDVTPGSPRFGDALGRGWLTTAGRITRYICPNWLGIRRGSGDPLPAGATIAAVLLNGIRTSEAEGRDPFARSSDLDAILGASRPSDGDLGPAWDSYQPLRDWLAEEDSPAAADVLNATVFTTQDPTALIPALRSAIRAEAAPVVSDVTVCDEGVASPCDDGELRVCGAANDDFWEVHARVALPQFQQGTLPYEEPEDGGGIRLGAGDVPIVDRADPVCMMMTIPKGVATPAEGYPVLFYAHGTGGAFTSAIGLGLAATFAQDDGGSGAPHAITVGIDLPLHGARRGDSQRSPDVLVFNFANPRAARGNFLQGAADLMSLVYWAESYTLPAAASPTGFDVSFDPARMAVWGHSQGATHAQLMVPFEPSLIAALISGGGGDLTQSLLTKTRPVDIAGLLPLALLDPAGDGTLAGGDYHPALPLFQMYYEAVDPVNFGRLYVRQAPGGAIRHVFMTYGEGDSFSTEETLGAFARSAFRRNSGHVGPVLVDIGLGDAVPPPLSGNITHMDADYTAGMRQYAPEAGSDGHFVSTGPGRADTTRFILEALSGATPPIGQ